MREFTCDGISDGETICTGCWDKSGHDIKADTNIPKGEPIYWSRASYEYDEWDSWCRKCAAEEAARTY
jgi:hypothetical protein